MIAFGNLKTPDGQNSLNSFLADKSYISGHAASQDDLAIYEALGQAPLKTCTHILRWYKHISTYLQDKSSLPVGQGSVSAEASPAPADDDDDIDLFGSDDEEEDAEAERIKQDRLKAYADKKSKKPGPIAKSQILLDCKPWDDETDMAELEKHVRTIEMDGLTWGASKLNPLAFGIMKLSILCTVEDAKVSVDDLIEKIQEFEDFVQSVDIAAFNKV